VGVKEKMNLTNFARQLRINQTEAEKILWKRLRSKQLLSLKFRRQQPIGKYIADFVCFENKLIIELDGSQHIDHRDQDVDRDKWLSDQGFTVLRFWNKDIMNNIDGVMKMIYGFVTPSPDPSHRGRGDNEDKRG
jgi:very-short-patch-repair endonuclease